MTTNPTDVVAVMDGDVQHTIPEVLVVAVSGGHAPYLAWVGNEVGA